MDCSIDKSVQLLASLATAGVAGESTVTSLQRIKIEKQITLAGGLLTTKDVCKNETILVLWYGNTISWMEINVQGWYNGNVYYDHG